MDEQAEQSLLGALLSHESPASYLLSLTEEDMAFEAHKVALTAMQRLSARREPFDLMTVCQEAQKDQRNANWSLSSILLGCMRMAPSTVMTAQYFNRVKDVSNRRRLQTIARDISEKAQDMSSEADALIADAMDELRRISAGKDRWHDISVLAAQAFDDVERLSRGDITFLPTGIPDLDKAIGGLFPGEVTVLGARPAVGKSAMASYIGACLASKGKRVGICSLEMSPVQYMKRLLAAYSGVDGRKLRTGKDIREEEWVQLGEALCKLSEWDMPFTFSVNTVEELAAEARRRKDSKGLDLLIIDYMQLLRVKRPVESEFVRVSVVSHDIKRLALDLEIPILALAQVARPEQKGRLQMPTLDSLRGSGDIEQDADNVLFLHRPLNEDDPSINPERLSVARACINGDGNQYVVCNIAKQRNGTNRTFDMIFDPAHMTYRCFVNR